MDTTTTATLPDTGDGYCVLTRNPIKIVVDDDGLVYRIHADGGGNDGGYAVLGGRQAGHALDGSYGRLAQVIATAQVDQGVPVCMAWQGVVNGMGDHAALLPPLIGTPLDVWIEARCRSEAERPMISTLTPYARLLVDLAALPTP